MSAQTRGPLPVSEQVPGLLSQAKVLPAYARLAAFGEFPGAQLVAAEIRLQGNRLVYRFDLNFAGRVGNEQVQIDAVTGQILCVEYSVEQDPEKYLAMTASPELVSLVKSSFPAAQETACSTVGHGHVVGCKLRVEPAQSVYVFDVDVADGAQHVLQQALIDVNTGAVLSTRTPR